MYYAYCDRPSGGLMGLVRSSPLIKRIRRNNSRYRWQQDHVILNWGCTRVDLPVPPEAILNCPGNVVRASNKYLCLSDLEFTVEPAFVVPFTNDYQEAKEWLDEGHTVLVRTRIRASEGRGIVVVEGENELPQAQLYTKYIRPNREFRVYVGREYPDMGTRNSYLIKAKRWPNDTERSHEANLIRNYTNGWVLGSVPERYRAMEDDILETAIQAITVLDLDFGAVDLIVHDNREQISILEVNTAPGIDSPSTLEWMRNYLYV